MESFISRKRRAIGPSMRVTSGHRTGANDDESTEFKLAILASLCPNEDTNTLLDALLLSDGSVDAAAAAMGAGVSESPRKKARMAGYQASLRQFRVNSGNSENLENSTNSSKVKQLTQKGKTLHLYSPEDIALHTPCSIIHNFLSPDDADALLNELLAEAPTFGRDTFKLFDRTVSSPHSIAFYVDNWDEAEQQKTDYLYNGSRIADVRRTLNQMRRVSVIVRDAVNEEIKTRIQTHYPGQRKLKYQSPKEWVPNTAFVNCYDGGKESVGYHSDQLTYLGPRAVIGSLSLGVAREFRVRRVVPREIKLDATNAAAKRVDDALADTEGQISIHLPHNSLLVMHADMQEEWKHSIAPAQVIDPHPIAENKRINITYRCYRESFHPRYTPRCHCNCPTVLRCVQKKQENRGRYMWMCHAGYTPGQDGCTFFQWAEFDDDGENVKGVENLAKILSKVPHESPPP